jgi:pilus assembly protein CpaC
MAISLGLSAAWPSSAEAETTQALPESMVLNMRQSATLSPPWPVTRVAVTDPQIADVQVLTPKQILVMGKAVGSTDLVLWSEGEQTQRVRLEVVLDLRYLQSELGRLFPRAHLELSQSQGVLAVRGTLERADQVVALNRFFETAGVKFINMTSLAGTQQVLLQVRVAEVQRSVLRQLGINAFKGGDHFFGASLIGPASGGAINPMNVDAFQPGPVVLGDTSISSAVSVLAGFPNSDLTFFIQALAENQYLRVLAEPNLVALSGEKATFLAGGEYPIPVVQGGTAGGTGSSISIEYKKFGVQLDFQPIVLGDGTIRLRVAPEVSELSDAGAVTIQGFQIPSLITRRVETTLELKSGQTFAMAGLITHNVNARNSRVPGLGDIPVLGALFRSVRYIKGETELVVLVTASLVEPLSLVSKPPLPGSLHVTPDDWELYGLGQIQGAAAPRLSPADAAWLRKMGFASLKGPGGWDSYDRGVAKSQATARPAAESAAKPSAAKPCAAPPSPQAPKPSNK